MLFALTAMDRAGKEKFGFSVWLGDEERIVPWTERIANAPWNGTEWVAILHDSVKEQFGFPRAAKLDLVYEDKAGDEQKLIIGPNGVKRSAYWNSLSERTQNATRCKNGRVDIKGVRGLPNLDFKVSFRGDKKLVSWPREKEVADSAANDLERPWKTIQNLTCQVFNLPYETQFIMSVEDPDGDDVLIPDANVWNKFLSLLPLDKESLKTIQIVARPLNEDKKLAPTNKVAKKPQTGQSNKDVLGFPVRKLGGKPVELPTKVLIRSGPDTELGTLWICGSKAKGTDAERWLDGWNLAFQAVERLFGIPEAVTKSLEIIDSAKVAITLSTPWCWQTFSELLTIMEKRVRHLEVDISGPTPSIRLIAPSSSTQAGAGVVSQFEVKHIKDVPVLFFVMEPAHGPGSRTITHIAKWEKTSEDESWDAEWDRVHNHVWELFALPDEAPYTLYYVDDDRDEISVSVPDDWRNFLAFVNKKKSVVRKLHVRMDPSYSVPAPLQAAPAPWGEYLATGLGSAASDSFGSSPLSPDSTSSTILMQELSLESEGLSRQLADAKREAQVQREARAELAQMLSQTTNNMMQQIQELTSQVVRLTTENTALLEKNEMLRAGMAA